MIRELKELQILRDESDRKGMRIVIEVRKDANANVLLNNLYKHTSMQTSFGINILALSRWATKSIELKAMSILLLRTSKSCHSSSNRI